jgi:N-methylhydantoinase A
MTRTFSVGVDTGEMFTHCAVVGDEGETYVGRAPTDPDSSVGFFGAITEAAEAMDLTLQGLMSHTARIVHATSVGMAALATRTEPQIALLATEGHGDTAGGGTYRGSLVYEPDNEWELSAGRGPSLIDRANIFEIRERVDFSGDVQIPLDRSSVVGAAREICSRGITSVAISLLWGHVNPTHERNAREVLKEECLRQGVEPFVTCAHEVSPHSGETARAAITISNAYIASALHRDVSRILERARVAGFVGELLFAGADGALIDARRVIDFPVRTLQGGPSAGVAACLPLGREAGSRDLLFTSLGETGLDVGRVLGEELRPMDDPVERRPHGRHGELVESHGLGGGAVAWIDEGGRLRVGPASAGAWPGPACFRRGGTDPTLTDADLLSGVLNPNLASPDGAPVDKMAATDAIRGIAEPLGMTVTECAAGIVEIADSIAESVLRKVAFGREGDLRQLDLWAAGGVAGMHAGAYAFGLGVRRLVFPMGDMASDWAAYALATAQDAVAFSVPLSEKNPLDLDRLESARKEVAKRATSFIGRRDSARSGNCNAVLKEWVQIAVGAGEPAIRIPLPAGALDDATAVHLAEEFQAACIRRYGEQAALESPQIAISGAHLRGEIGRDLPAGRAKSTHIGRYGPTPDTERLVFWREVDSVVSTPVYNGRSVLVDDEVPGPALIDCSRSTVSIRPGQLLKVDRFGNFVVTRTAGSGDA